MLSTQRAAVPLLAEEHVVAETKAIQSAFRPKRDYLLSQLERLGVRVDRAPDGTFYVWGCVEDLPAPLHDGMAFFRAALDVRASAITENMKLAAADAIAALVGDDAAPDYVIPSQFDERVAPAVAAAVAAQARLDAVARR